MPTQATTGRKRSPRRPRGSPAWTEPRMRWHVQRRRPGLGIGDQRSSSKRIKKRRGDKCRFCHGPRMSRSHVLLHCPNAKLWAAREETWEGRDPGGIRVPLNNPRRERRLLRFLELSGVGRVVEDGTDVEEARATRMDGWIA